MRPATPAAGHAVAPAADLSLMRVVLATLLAAGALWLATAPAANADVVAPRSAAAFSDSVGVVTHIVYYDTAYGDWPRVVAKLDELGVRHVRDGVYGNPKSEWRDWNERYYRAVELAAARGIRFAFGIGPPRSRTGNLDQLIGVIGGRLRHAAEAIEAPNEFDKYVGGPGWPSVLASFERDLYRKAKAHASVRSLPLVGPSFATPDAPQRVGDLGAWLDVGNIHPYTGGRSPDPQHLRSELERASLTAGRKPVWATEAGFHNALRARDGQPPVSERAGAVYLLRTFLEHFRSGIDRTYAYELIDEKSDRGAADPEQHFGLLSNDFTPKPAFTALKNLLSLVGRGDRRSPLRPLRIEMAGAQGQVRRLVLQKPDGSYVVALWRLASVWDADRRRPLRVAARSVTVELPDAARVASADPLASPALRPLALHGGRVRVRLAGEPLLLRVTPRRQLSARS